MSMFGTLSAFGQIDPKYITRGFGTSADQTMPAPVRDPFTPSPTPNPYTMQPQHLGFFSDGGAGRSIAGSIGDALLQLSHAQPIYGPAMQAQRDFAQRRQEAEQESQRSLSNEEALYNYKLQNPEPDQMSDFDKQAVAGGYAPGTPDWVTLHKQHVQEIADPVVTTPAGMMLRSQALAQMGGTPAPAGVTFTPIPEGGPTPKASGNFPNIRRYYGGQ
jgi:hypothetical protein